MVGIETLNQWAQSWAEFMGYRLLDSTIVLMIVGSLWFLLRRRVSAQLGYWLFLLVLFKLILPGPISLHAPVNGLVLGNAVVGNFEGLRFEPGQPALRGAPTNTDQKPANSSSITSTAVHQGKSASGETAPTPTLSVLALLMLGWTIIVFLLMTRLVWYQWCTHRALNDADSLDESTVPIDLAQIQEIAGVKRPVRWLTCSWASAPVVWGVLRPAIVVPFDLFTNFSKNQIRWILLHELAHIRRGDNVVSMFQGIVQIVFFFHPAVWIANILIDEQREFACDDAALAGCEAPRSDCGEGLLSIARNANGLPTFMTSSLGLLKRNTFIRRRMMRILDTKRKLRLGLSAGSLALLLLAALMLLPSVRAEETQVNDNRMLAQAEAETDTSTTKSLHEAAAAGDLELVKSLVSKGVNVNAKDKSGCTALHCVARWEPGRMVQHVAKQDPEAMANSWEQAAVFPKIAELLISKDAQVNIQDNEENTPLHYAAKHANKDIAKLLIANGADVDAKNQAGSSPLQLTWDQEVGELLIRSGAKVPTIHDAARLGDLAKVKAFISQGVPIDSKKKVTEDFAHTPLSMAAAAGHEDVVEFLLNKGAEPGNALMMAKNGAIAALIISHGADVNPPGQTSPLHQAAVTGKKDVAEALLSNGADTEARDRNGQTPLSLAMTGQQKEIVFLLVDKGADVNTKDNWGQTPLHYVARLGWRDVAEALLAKGADVDARTKTKHEVTPLYWATRRGHAEVVDLLMEHGADPVAFAKDTSGQTLSGIALEEDHKDVVRTLAAKGAADIPEIHLAAYLGEMERLTNLIENEDVNTEDQHNKTPLTYAALGGNLDVVRWLLTQGAEINAADEEGMTPLHSAVAGRHKAVIELLLDKGADVAADSPESGTPLHIAAGTRGNEDLVRLLIDHGADVNAWNERIGTPLHVAVGQVQKALVRLLIAKGADVNAKGGHTVIGNGTQPSNGGTPLHASLCHPYGNEVAEPLLLHGAKVNAKNNVGATPLHVAVQRPHREPYVRLLVAYGADVNAEDNNGRTPLELAEENNRYVELLRKHGTKE